MKKCELKRVWTDSEDSEFSEYEIEVNNEHIHIKNQSYYISKPEIELACEKIEKFRISNENEMIIEFGDFGSGFPPALQFKVKKINEFKNLLITIKCEIEVDDLENNYDVCSLSCFTDFIMFTDFLKELLEVAVLKKVNQKLFFS